ncbi:SUMF1/EgtB/PvdO family nonheme iron enzyme [Bythopirellula polymerisocia]|uniref:Formylglycine-generating sulfatase enzyme n=1 Tax=Bythopirellula polymerisocia TaxID=2528003 RepID=A0A5C6CXU8_9BACT|nr:SUMF1/EgtB/PvdO family nonheme iron enzyme [Bythopirellula polymerisocia]TWU28367.1 Formylglycine-generating sulfatase enzyme [Bythopirellula polymerisocia]
MLLSRNAALIMMAATAASLLCVAPTQAKKPGNPGGGTPSSYELVDLLGFDNGGLGLQSYADFVTNRNLTGDILIYGRSYQRYPNAPSDPHPALWHVDNNGSFPSTDPVNLGTPSFAWEVTPTGINSFGVRVGGTSRALEQDDQGNWVSPGYVDVPGISYQEVPSPTGRNTNPSAINDDGVMVGTYDIVHDLNHREIVGSVWQVRHDGTIDDPVSLGNFYPTDINNSGVMAGSYEGYAAIAWFEESELAIQQLNNSLRYLGSNINAINDYPIGDERLTVVGTARADETGDYNAPDRGFAWRPFDSADPTTVLGTLGGRTSDALDVNKLGQIVGWSDTKRQGQQAFIYSDGTMSNLNTLVDAGNATLGHANGINDDGDIVGFMGIPRPISEARGFLLRPIPAALSAASVPEPSTATLLIVAFAGILYCTTNSRRGRTCVGSNRYFRIVLNRAACPSTRSARPWRLLLTAPRTTDYERKTNMKPYILSRAMLAISVAALMVCAAPVLIGIVTADTFGSGLNTFDIEFVTIGNPGNTADTTGSPAPVGSVPYEYRIGKFEVSENMIDRANALGGLGITKTTRAPDKPATGVTWFEAAQFVNWLNTSTGNMPAYQFGAGGFQLWQPGDAGYDANNLYRNSLARYFLPNVDEWYKAAYYDSSVGVYYDYPTGSDSVPDGIDFPGDSAFDAVFFDGGSNPQPNDITDVGVLSPYGTAGQGGNVHEWEETDLDLVNDSALSARGLRGGDYVNVSSSLKSLDRNNNLPTTETSNGGFRVARIAIPEPSSLLLGVLAAVGFVFRRRQFSK